MGLAPWIFIYQFKHYQYPGLHLSRYALGANEIAFAFPRNSQLVEKVNKSLTYLQDHQLTLGICNKYIEPSESLACII